MRSSLGHCTGMMHVGQETVYRSSLYSYSIESASHNQKFTNFSFTTVQCFCPSGVPAPGALPLCVLTYTRSFKTATTQCSQTKATFILGEFIHICIVPTVSVIYSWITSDFIFQFVWNRVPLFMEYLPRTITGISTGLSSLHLLPFRDT